MPALAFIIAASLEFHSVADARDSALAAAGRQQAVSGPTAGESPAPRQQKPKSGASPVLTGMPRVCSRVLMSSALCSLHL